MFIMMARSIFGQKKTIAKIYENEYENGEEQEYSVPEAVFEQFEADVGGLLVTDKADFIDFDIN